MPVMGPEKCFVGDCVVCEELKLWWMGDVDTYGEKIFVCVCKTHESEVEQFTRLVEGMCPEVLKKFERLVDAAVVDAERFAKN